MTDEAQAVLEGDYLLRRIHPDEVYRPDDGPSRPFSTAFKARSPGEPLSVFVERLLIANGLDERALLVGHERFFVVGFSAAFVRELELDAELDPNRDDPVAGRGRAHAIVTGSITRSRQTKIANRCDRRIWE